MPGEYWTALPQLAWILVLLLIFLMYREDLSDLIRSMVWRLKAGAPLKLGGLELGQCYVSPGGAVAPNGAVNAERKDDGARECERDRYYQPNRRLFLVHKVRPSAKKGQLYDILIYLIPHKDASLAAVQKVEYYFGPYWGNKIFTVADRARGFPISTSAYGPFVCSAELFFTDGERAIVSRYIDFEMGGLPAISG